MAVQWLPLDLLGLVCDCCPASLLDWVLNANRKSTCKKKFEEWLGFQLGFRCWVLGLGLRCLGYGWARGARPALRIDLLEGNTRSQVADPTPNFAARAAPP